MNQQLPDIASFTKTVFHKQNVLGFLLSFSRKLMDARQACLIYGTDGSGAYFLPPCQWDRGVVDKFRARGKAAPFYTLLGRLYIQLTGLSPVYLYRTDEMGQRIETDGVIAYTLRNHQTFYDKGVKILLIDNPVNHEPNLNRFKTVEMVSYDGRSFKTGIRIRSDTRISNRLGAVNFMAAYIPDYGAVVFNTVGGRELTDSRGCFVYGDELGRRLNFLISCIETASLAHLGRVRGKASAQMIWRKERGLRQSYARLKEKEKLVEEQEKQLWAVGAVTPDQLTMPPASVNNGVFAFMDMVGSVGVSQKLPPRDYFFLLNCCHEIAAENAGRYGCRVDNIIGDAVFFQNVSVLDLSDAYRPGPLERLMLMTLLVASVLVQIDQLVRGAHPFDRERRVYSLIKSHRVKIGFRAGMNQGTAQVGVLGSRNRKIVTAVGEAVDLASRLESSGRVNYIHTPESLYSRLKQAWISEETAGIYKFAPGTGDGLWENRQGFYFFDFYKAFFNIKGAVAADLTRAGYKEFSSSDTCLVRCLPDSEPDFCPGI